MDTVGYSSEKYGWLQFRKFQVTKCDSIDLCEKKQKFVSILF